MWCTEWATFSLYPSNYPKTLKELLSISTRNILLSVITKKNRYSDTKTIKGERASQPLIDYAFRFFTIF